MTLIHYTTPSGRTETAEFTTSDGADLFASWLRGEGLDFVRVEQITA